MSVLVAISGDLKIFSLFDNWGNKSDAYQGDMNVSNVTYVVYNIRGIHWFHDMWYPIY